MYLGDSPLRPAHYNPYVKLIGGAVLSGEAIARYLATARVQEAAEFACCGCPRCTGRIRLLEQDGGEVSP